MMIVYDVIQNVSPAAAKYSSHRAGSRWIESHDSQAVAAERAATYNRHAFSGIEYGVQEIDESSPERMLP